MTEAVVIELSQEQLNLQAKAKAFAEREIKPIVAERDRLEDPTQGFPWDVWRKGARLGFRVFTLPPEHGGISADVLTHCVVLEELAVGDPSLGGMFHQVWKLQTLLLKTGYLKREILPKFLADDDYHFALGFTEPEVGTDNALPYDGADGGPKTTAVRQPNGDWLINGKKHFQTASNTAKGIFFLARTDPTKPVAQGGTIFFVESTTPGFHTGHNFSKMGWRLMPNGEMVFEDVRLADAARVSDVNAGLTFAGEIGKPHAPTTAVFGIATSRQAFELTRDRLMTQTRHGKPSLEHQPVAMRLADIWAEIELVRTLTWKAAWSGEHNPNHDLKLGMIAQLSAAEMVVRVCSSALQLWGGDSYRRDHPIERLYRDAFANYHIDGLNDLNRLRIARALSGRAGAGYIG